MKGSKRGSGNEIALDYNDFPQEGQKRSETMTGFPHLGQKPDDFSLRDLCRAAIMDSTSSSLNSGLTTDASARRAAIAFSMRASTSCTATGWGARVSIWRK